MKELLESLGLAGEQPGAGTGCWTAGGGPFLYSHSPIDSSRLGLVRTAGSGEIAEVIRRATAAFAKWRMTPAPKRGELVRLIGDAVRQRKDELGALISLEVGKIRAEGEGEVREMLDMCDYALGLSRMLHGSTMHSERPGHRMYEQWHPLGPVAVITSFNFPLAVWAWNAMLCLVCGNPVIWKPSSKAPLTALAVMKIAWRVLAKAGAPEGLLCLAVGDRGRVGEALAGDPRLPLVSATGSTAMGRKVGAQVAARLGRTILELGGNNAAIVTPAADLAVTVPALVFGAVGTAGQRCTSTRRLIVHESMEAKLVEALKNAYSQVTVGDPLKPGTLMGPLIDAEACTAMQKALAQVEEQGGHVIQGGEVLNGGLYDMGAYVTPAICRGKPDMPILREEVFAPLLHVLTYREMDEAIALQNDAPQGLSSVIFSNDLREVEAFLSHRGSDCGLANVNAATSGAEIGGAFGGEKDTGGGREAGSDAWKAYMRRQTNVINWSTELPLAQGIDFKVGE